MTPADYLGNAFAFVAFVAAAGFFWHGKNVAGFAFIAALIIALAGMLQQRVVFSSAFVGLTVERSSEPSKR
jgi:hypothetical protein